MYVILNTFISKTKNIVILWEYSFLEAVEIEFVETDRKTNSIQVSLKI